MGRFINADILMSTGQGLLGNNMFAYCNNVPVICLDSEGMRLMLASAGGGSIWYELYGNWRYRIEGPNTSSKTKRHIHVQNKKTKEEYIQHDDGSPSHENKSKKGNLPNKVQEKLMEKTGWDYNGNRDKFYTKTTISARDDGIVYIYADGTQVVVPYSLHSLDPLTMLESVYYGHTTQENHLINSCMPMIEGGFPYMVPSWAWGSTPIVPAF